MKKKFILLTAATFALLLSAGVAYSQEQIFSGWSFFAPSVSDRSAIDPKGVGDITFDTSAGKFYGWNGSAWAEFGSSIPSATVVTKNSTSTISGSDDVVLANATSGVFTLTLPAASANDGKFLRIKKTDSNISNAITIAAGSGDTVGGSSSTTLNTEGETLVLVSDGASNDWTILGRNIPSKWVSFTPSSTQGLGTPSAYNMFWRRAGDSIEISGTLVAGTVSGVELQIGLPTGVTSSANIPTIQIAGPFILSATSSASRQILIEPSKTYMTVGAVSASSGLAKVTGGTLANNTTISLLATIPVSGWNGY